MEEAHVRPARPLFTEHADLRRVLHRIESMLANPPDPAGRLPWLKDLCDRLREYKPRLDAHFAAEEDGGLFDEIEDHSPGAAEAARKFCAEHPELIGRLEDLIEAASRKAADDAGFQSLLAQARDLVHTLESHEERENDLLYRVLDGGDAALD